MGKTLVVKLKKGKGQGCFMYKNEINAEDFRQIAIILSDLENNGLNIEKAVQEFKKKKEKGEFPW